MIKKRRRTNQPARSFSAKRSGGGETGKARLNGGKKFGSTAPRRKSTFEKVEDKYKDTPAMSIEERKAAQLAKWRKELGLDSD